MRVLDSEQPSEQGFGLEDQGVVEVAETTGRYVVVFADPSSSTGTRPPS